jgi:hypothetical protein
MANSGAFQYQPLHDTDGNANIRLLVIQPGSRSSEIRCNLVQVRLGDRYTRYNALSYVWGPQDKLSQIICNGQPFKVGINLYTALERVRHDDQVVTYWIDAICIDQTNIEEKSRQVQLMQYIYAGAQAVHIWLGPKDKTSNLAFYIVGRICEHVALTMPYGGPRPVTRLREYPKEVRESYPNALGTNRTGYKALLQLISRPWFTRVWVIQEVTMASHAIVMCGPDQMPWHALQQAVDFMRIMGGWDDHVHEFGHSFSTIARSISEKKMNQQLSLVDCLFRYRRWASTDPRDKIYAFFGVAAEDVKRLSGFTTDYNLSTRQVYKQLVADVINKTQSLALLAVPSAASGLNPLNLPSWVPDWSQPANMRTLMLEELPHSRHYHRFRAAAGSKHISRPSTQDDGLMTTGILLDTIQILGPTSNVWGDEYQRFKFPGKEARQIYQTWIELSGAKSGAIYPFTGEKVEDAYWQTSYGGYVNYRYEDARAQYYLKQSFWDYPFLISVARMVAGGMADMLSGDHIDNMAENRAWVDLQRVQHNRRMGRTSSGFICLTTSTAQVGDWVAILTGSDVPLILRSKADSFELVGEVYVHGIMYGERYNPTMCRLIELI